MFNSKLLEFTELSSIFDDKTNVNYKTYYNWFSIY